MSTDESVTEVPNADDDVPEPPPRGVRAMSIFRWGLIVVAASLAAFSWFTLARADPAAQSAPRYYCPMHPQITSHDPGECPICHMTLEPIPKERKQKAAAPAPAAAASASAHQHDARPGETLYVCPMHPEVQSETPGTCPICKMDLVPRKVSPAASSADMPPGTAPIELTLDRVQAIGVRTALVQTSGASGMLRAPAVVEAAESGVAQVHARAGGFIERVAVKETGVKVRAGQELAAIYSPEIYQAQAELLTVKGWGAQGQSAETEQRVRQKLALLGVGSGTIDQVLKRKEPLRTVSLSAPISGFVIKKNVVLGSFVTPETPLFEIVDLSKVYVIANLYASELARAKVGTEGTFRATNKPEPSFTAKVDLVYPSVDPDARTTRVRLQVKSADVALVPGEYGYVEFSAPGTHSVSVPRDAIIDTGRHTYVFVALGAGQFSPRSVELGPELPDERVEIRSGLKGDERVVSGATFLIDSESRLRASLASPEPVAPPAPSGHPGHGP
jgi:membrane fusion protein, copper/silver efflux system